MNKMWTGLLSLIAAGGLIYATTPPPDELMGMFWALLLVTNLALFPEAP